MLRTALLKLGAFGIEPSVPVSAAGEDPADKAALAQQGQALLKLSGPRLDQGAALRTEPVATDQRGRRAQLAARMRAVFGESFVVLPRFTFDAAAATELDERARRRAPPRRAAIRWPSTRGSRGARACAMACRAWASCLQRAEVLGTGARLEPERRAAAVQERRALGRPAAGRRRRHAAEQAVARGAHHRSDQHHAAMTGLLVDEWVEVVPSTRETTALAFQFDPPDSCAPQSVLIAVPPVPGQDWTAETLRRVLMETLDLAKLRAVDTGVARRGRAAPARPLSRVQHRRPRRVDRLRSRSRADRSASWPQLFVTITFPPAACRPWTGRSSCAATSRSRRPRNWTLIGKSMSVQFGPGGQLVAGSFPSGNNWQCTGTVSPSTPWGSMVQLTVNAQRRRSGSSGALGEPEIETLNVSTTFMVRLFPPITPTIGLDPFASPIVAARGAGAVRVHGLGHQSAGADSGRAVQGRGRPVRERRQRERQLVAVQHHAAAAADRRRPRPRRSPSARSTPSAPPARSPSRSPFIRSHRSSCRRAPTRRSRARRPRRRSRAGRGSSRSAPTPTSAPARARACSIRCGC